MASNVFHLDRTADRLRFILTFYLKTTAGFDAANPSPIFSLPRSDRVDRLLQEMVAGRDITEELALALAQHHGRPITGESDALSHGWAREAARRVHGVTGLDRRLRRYVDALALRGQAVEEDEGEVVSLQAEPPTEPALLARRPRRTLPSDPLEPERTWSAERHYFQRRLSEELSRCGRDGAPLSVVLIQARELYKGTSSAMPLVEDSIRRGLREYDILCHTASGEYRVVLPGADTRACGQVMDRLRGRVAASVAAGPPVQVGFGCASWPEQGGRPEDLVEEASVALIEDRHRQLRSSSTAPESVESADVYPTTVWFEGFPQQVKVQALPTPQGIRLRMPLRFLRRGSSIQLESRAGVLADAALVRGRAVDTVPTLYIDVVPSGGDSRAT